MHTSLHNSFQTWDRHRSVCHGQCLRIGDLSPMIDLLLIKNNSCRRFRHVINIDRTQIAWFHLYEAIAHFAYIHVQRVDKRAWSIVQWIDFHNASRSLVHREEYTFKNGEPISARLEKTAICFTDTPWLSIVDYGPNRGEEAGGGTWARYKASQIGRMWPFNHRYWRTNKKDDGCFNSEALIRNYSMSINVGCRRIMSRKCK